MEDTIGKFFMYTLVIFAIFVAPLIFLFNNVDSMQRSYVDNKVQVYSEELRSTGYITKESYTNFLNELQKFNGPYEVNITHKSKTIVPHDKKEGEYRTAFKYYNTNDIKETIYSNEDYVMKDGDYISITVKSVNQTLGSKVYSAITRAYTNEKIYCTAGGMVGNTKR